MTQHSGREIKVHDRSRHPRDWNELLAPSDCAVFFSRHDTEAPLSPEGAPVARIRDLTFLLFERFEDARKFCEARVLEFPNMCCKIYDSKGLAQPPLLTVVHPSVAEKDELSPSSVRVRKIAAAVLFAGSLPLIWWDWHAGSVLILPTVIGINMIVIGLRLLQWNLGRQIRMDEQEKRIAAHLAIEKESSAGRQ